MTTEVNDSDVSHPNQFSSSNKDTSSKVDLVDSAMDTTNAVKIDSKTSQESSGMSLSSTSTTTSKEIDANENRYFVHSFLLSLYSDHFRCLFARSGLKEKREREVKIVVGQGESILFKKFLEAMYSLDTLESVPTCEIFGVMRLSERYCCDLIIEKCLECLATVEVNTAEDLNHGLQAVSSLAERAKFQQSVNSLKKQWTEKLISVYSPLEEKFNTTFEPFLVLNVFTLVEILSSPNLEVESENSVLSCIILWAEANKPNALMLEKLLKCVNIQCLSSNYLNDVITPKHHILSKTSYFCEWFVRALQYQSFPESRRDKKDADKYQRMYVNPGINRKFLTLRLTSDQAKSETGYAWRLYNKSDYFICKGYIFAFQVGISGSNAALRLYFHSLIGVDDEVFLSANFKFILDSSKSVKELKPESPPLLFMDKKLMFTSREETGKFITLGNIPANRMKEVYKELYAHLRIEFL